VPSISGTPPSRVHIVVIRIGRKRTRFLSLAPVARDPHGHSDEIEIDQGGSRRPLMNLSRLQPRKFDLERGDVVVCRIYRAMARVAPRSVWVALGAVPDVSET
jgi:hypothetical protein